MSRTTGQTEAFGAGWAQILEPGAILLLFGDLGAGKTVFARGIIRALHGIDEDLLVTSPTFTLMNPYLDGRLPVHHFDLYRLAEPEDLVWIGAEESFDTPGISLIEWPERGGEHIPDDHLA
ncbi:MAG: tRNA (adenosine(37)-N6)-threonylcarbamoyltransferase complex ATPase subunit type 1 TsaE, partial [Magnetococcales bacterium]|nr:tRNA (adenosine(37)-N6)-threonylcarbamoyltransferase complex ATPase subunit type 1 TsaE [Magnetococcales bacterium]